MPMASGQADPAPVSTEIGGSITVTPPPRSPQQRKQDTLNRLEHDADAWVATADAATGTPYLVPLSFYWDGSGVLIATPAANPTSRNLQATGKVRLGIGPTRDLVLIEGTVRAVASRADR
jgi:Pyridoxamine 5'-phosphate oxidase